MGIRKFVPLLIMQPCIFERDKNSLLKQQRTTQSSGSLQLISLTWDFPEPV